MPMSQASLDVALAALVHDIGWLFMQEHDGAASTHHEKTAHFLHSITDILERTGFDASRVVQWATHHELSNNSWKYVDEGSLIVALADKYAGKELDNAKPRYPLQPVFTSVSPGVPTQAGYDIHPLVSHKLFPNQGEGQLSRHIAHFKDRVRSFPGGDPKTFYSYMVNIMLEHLWCLPLPGQHEIPLFDHLRLTSAIAAALWNFHIENRTLNENALLDEEMPKFLLVAGDIGGIQNHIYRIRSSSLSGVGAIAKRLRSRSLQVSLATEAFALEILDIAEMPTVNRVISAGGNFVLLLPNTSKVRERLFQLERTWQAWALGRGATLFPTLAVAELRPSEFGRFAEKLSALKRKLAENKLQPFKALDNLVLPAAKTDYSPRPCRVCDAQPAWSETGTCRNCDIEAEVGRVLPFAENIGLWKTDPKPPFFHFPTYRAAPGQPGEFTYRTELSFEPEGHVFEIRPLTGSIPTVAKALDYLSLTPKQYAKWLMQEGLASMVSDFGDDIANERRPLTFGELAHLSKGAPYLGALMLDADRMGEIFAKSIPRDHLAPARTSALSRMLELFFGFVAQELRENPNKLLGGAAADERETDTRKRYRFIYPVYAGGDDVFVLGPWDAVLHYALDLYFLYRKYTAHHPVFTLSGGFVLLKATTPVPVISDRAQKAERGAKKAGRDRLFAFGRPVPWSEFPELLATSIAFEDLISSKALPKGIAHRLLALWDFYRTWVDEGDPRGLRYKPFLYYLKRHKNVRRHWDFFEPMFDHRHPRIRYLPVWVNLALLRERKKEVKDAAI